MRNTGNTFQHLIFMGPKIFSMFLYFQVNLNMLKIKNIKHIFTNFYDL